MPRALSSPAMRRCDQVDSGYGGAEVATATADLGAPAPEADAAEAAKPAEPEFDEVWFPAGRRPDNPRHNGQRHGRGQRPAAAATDGSAAPAPADGAERPQRQFRRPDRQAEGEGKQGRPRFDNNRRDGNGGGQREDRGGKPSFENRGGKPGGKRFDKPRDDWREHRPREKRDVPLDPDSPWAALAALRNPKPE